MQYKTAQYIERLKSRIASQKQIIGKRNKQFHILHERLYDINLMIHLFLALRELDHQWFKEFTIPEFFILHGTREMDTFKMEDAAVIISELPEAFIRLKPSKRDPMDQLKSIVNVSLKHLVALGYIGVYNYKKEKTYYIKPNGTWFLMQRVKEYRSLILAVLKAQAKPKRQVGLTRKI